MVALLVEAGRGELRDAHVPWVERFDQTLDATALARRVPPLEHHADRRPDLRGIPDLAAQDQAQVQEPALRRRQAVASRISVIWV